jgi:hypothetical protein
MAASVQFVFVVVWVACFGFPALLGDRGDQLRLIPGLAAAVQHHNVHGVFYQV